MSTFPDIQIMIEVSPGVTEAAPAGVTVYARADGEVADVTESPFTTDSDGRVVSGTIAGEGPSTVIHFRIEEHEGMAGSTAITTT